MLLTTDGALKRQLELPATGVERAYRARAYGAVTQDQLEALIHGVEIAGIRYGAIDANLERRTGANVWIELILTEGKNREVRRVLDYLGLKVSRLIRTRYGPFVLGDLPVGGIGEVKPQDIAAFRKDPTRKGGANAAAVAARPRAVPARPPAQAPAPAAPRPARRITKAAANRTDQAAFADPPRAPLRGATVLTKATKAKRFYDAKPKAGVTAPAEETRRKRVFSPELGRNVRAKAARDPAPADAETRAPTAAAPRRPKPHKPRTRK